MALVFPPSPTTGTTYAAPNGTTYTYNGTVWTASSTTPLVLASPGYITGVANAGETLNFSGYLAAGGTTPYTFTWIWKNNFGTTLQTNGTTYVVPVGQVGNRVYVQVTVTDANSQTASAQTAYTQTVGSVFIDPFYTNTQTVTSNYTLSAGYNAISAGPITVNSGVTVTVPSGSSWSVI